MMDLLNNIRVPRISGIYRIILWVVLLTLTGIILRYPVEFNPSGFAQVESIAIFENLPVFEGIFINRDKIY